MAEINDLNTRGYLNHLIDYEYVFNETKQFKDAPAFINDIPSISLIFLIAQINLSLYLNDSGDAGQKKQIELIKSYTVTHSVVLKSIIDAYRKIVEDGMWPTMFYRYSNLLYYELIFTNFNELPFRELTQVEKENVLRAYLIINGEVNSRITISDHEANEGFKNDTIEEVLLPNFIYQHDYRSNVDFSNQLTRAVCMFKYLDSHSKYGVHMPEYYKDLKVRSANELIYRISEIFTLVRNVGKDEMQLIISTADDPDQPHNQVFMNLAIDLTTFIYDKDDSFRQFRNKMFLFTPHRKFLLLDIGFLIDYLYKTQIFSLSKFFRTKGLKNFLSNKAKEFMEEIYLHEIMLRCFPIANKYSGKDLIKNNKEELIDSIITEEENMLMIEFKDTILNSESKNSGNKDVMFDALDIKFLEDEGPKGITQLKNAIKYLDKNFGDHSEFSFQNIQKIYPVIIYTDNAFGFDGINKIYKEKFKMLLLDQGITKFEIKDVTFINLSFFEINEDYLNSGELNIFELIEDYHTHTNHSNFSTTPFEVFATSFRKQKIKRDAQSTSFFKHTTAEMINGFVKQLGF